MYDELRGRHDARAISSSRADAANACHSARGDGTFCFGRHVISRVAAHELAHFDKMTVRVAHVATDLSAAVDRWGEKVCSASAPLFVDSADIGNTDIQKA